eukprot:Sspe_Gene.88779::Locus_60704_Transcript_1_1_Confidence_1.000_Length_1079::g.88779::m.88779
MPCGGIERGGHRMRYWCLGWLESAPMKIEYRIAPTNTTKMQMKQRRMKRPITLGTWVPFWLGPVGFGGLCVWTYTVPGPVKWHIIPSPLVALVKTESVAMATSYGMCACHAITCPLSTDLRSPWLRSYLSNFPQPLTHSVPSPHARSTKSPGPKKAFRRLSCDCDASSTPASAATNAPRWSSHSLPLPTSMRARSPMLSGARSTSLFSPYIAVSVWKNIDSCATALRNRLVSRPPSMLDCRRTLSDLTTKASLSALICCPLLRNTRSDDPHPSTISNLGRCMVWWLATLILVGKGEGRVALRVWRLL